MSSDNETTENSPKPPFMSDRVYDSLKWIAMIFLPALATLYLALGGYWESLPLPQQVAGSIMAIDAFLGLILGLSSRKYKATEAVREEEKTIGTVYVARHGDGTPDPHLEFKDEEAMRNLGNTDKVILNVTNL